MMFTNARPYGVMLTGYHTCTIVRLLKGMKIRHCTATGWMAHKFLCNPLMKEMHNKNFHFHRIELPMSDSCFAFISIAFMRSFDFPYFQLWINGNVFWWDSELWLNNETICRAFQAASTSVPNRVGAAKSLGWDETAIYSEGRWGTVEIVHQYCVKVER